MTFTEFIHLALQLLHEYKDIIHLSDIEVFNIHYTFVHSAKNAEVS